MRSTHLALLFVLGACGSAHEPPPAEPSSERTAETGGAGTEPSEPGPGPREASAVPAATEADLRCEPVNYSCGCRWDCALVREIDGVFVRLDSEGEQQFVRDDCSSGGCFETCEGERCEPALVMESQECEESCPPSRAPYACARVAGEHTDPTGRPCQPR